MRAFDASDGNELQLSQLGYADYLRIANLVERHARIGKRHGDGGSRGRAVTK